ncbi:DUF3379 domain-containing protein [Parashewanella curva]|uniref:DUF3379 domain-containing protein n=1 Tax=Parashewanella curva TaxID=2338552 RepID=A0A3L8PYQ8_9GAMM|nr:DUF3379 family protein [Parashewanella curva]RLV60360.1 DUF3379 domain-containing protein [Parashewanella curva]
MDELEFRRKAYAEPHSQDEAFLEAANADSAKHDFLSDLKSLDNKIADALHVSPPEDLTERLILRQQLKQHQKVKRTTSFVVSMAASVAFVAGVTFTMLRTGEIDLTSYAIAHQHHGPEHFSASKDISFAKINHELNGIKGLKGGHFTKQPGQVVFAKYCDFQGIKGMHLVMQNKTGGQVTVFIIPNEDRMIAKSNFEKDGFEGMTFDQNGNYMILVGKDQQDLNYVKKEIKDTFI